MLMKYKEVVGVSFMWYQYTITVKFPVCNRPAVYKLYILDILSTHMRQIVIGTPLFFILHALCCMAYLWIAYVQS